MTHLPQIGRRGLLLGLGTLATMGRARLALADAAPASAGQARLVIVLLRGALDGLSLAQPYAEPGWAELRGGLALPEPGREGGVLDLGGRFGLHPKLTAIHGLYAANQAMVLHAVAAPYRTRSHFDAQDLLESGAETRLSSGWLNRALTGLPEALGEPRPGLATGLDMPLLLRGDNPVGMYAATRGGRPDGDLYARLLDLNRDDPLLGPAMAEGLRARAFAEAKLPPEARRSNGFVALAAAAGRLLATPEGPRVAALESGGWDTHAQQAQRLDGPLAALDAGMAALAQALGEAWRHTAVLVMTEFGRTVRANGNNGTDHGTGGVALLLGGAVAGGRIGGDWPGLGRDALLDNRDLRPTTDLRTVAKGLLRDHLGLPPAALALAFPDSETAAPLGGLLRG
ncbi:DUF1501 domain-containing protein [Humitalea sp. 24SJ18S-53]|uniref:DUF1501 domain-containing protein n=1 Tax=Humitalea sp. 24SJ18S-53 TaxID=3422307 RepID=UPI003D67D787